jgi:hypothetical protein
MEAQPEMLTRRQLFLSLVRAGLLVGSAPLMFACREQGDSGIKMAESPLAEYAQNMKAISYIGPLCIARAGFAEGDSRDIIQHTLMLSLEQKIAEEQGDADLVEILDQLIRKDFAAGDIVEIEGWQLSSTECELAALAAAFQGYLASVIPEGRQEQTGTIVEVINWGPQSTLQGELFNEQADGHSGMWIKAAGAPASVVVLFNGESQGTQVYDEHITSGIRGEFMRKVVETPGVYPVELLDRSRMIRQKVGEFRVIETAAPKEPGSPADCTVQSWGPNRSISGQPFNEQPGGASAFWVKTDCALPGAELVLDGVPLKTTVRENLLTASVPAGHRLEPGQYELIIRAAGSGTPVKAGVLQVEP